MEPGLIARAAAALRPSRSLVDVGPGIRPQRLVRAARHLCIEPHGQYVRWLRRRGYEVIQATAREALPAIEPADAIVMLDVIEHMEKAEGEAVLRLAREKAGKVVVLTPLGYREQRYAEGARDAWGMNGTFWQTHRSGWLPEEFAGWSVFVDPVFFRKKGGAFVAIWSRP